MNIIHTFNIDHYQTGMVFIFVLVLFFVISQYVVSRFFIKKTHDPEVIGGFFQVIGTMYAVVLGLVVVDGMDRFSSANDIISGETKALVQVYTLSERFTTPQAAERIRSTTKAYIDEVVANDWLIMQDDLENFEARKLLKKLINEIKYLEPVTKGDEIIMPLVLEAAMDAWGLRLDRVHQAQHNIPNAEWAILLIGALITILTSFLFPLESQLAHSALTGLTAIMIFMSLYAVLMFSEPFKGDFVVSNQPFLTVQRIMSGAYYGLDH